MPYFLELIAFFESIRHNGRHRISPRGFVSGIHVTQSSTSSVFGIGRLTGLALGLVAFLCVTMIGLTGYLKYELDRAESALVSLAPSAIPPADQNNPDISAQRAGEQKTAQERTQLWSMLLMLEGLCSSFFGVLLVIGIYLALRDRNSAPMRALAQSVKNMAKGDMRTPIWGMERRDSVGELARAVDMARYQFSQIPDLTLLSEEGSVRLRFEGHTRSMFEAMMSVISRDSEQVHEQAARLKNTVTQHQDALALLIGRVEAVLHKTENRAVQGDQQVRVALQGMLGSAESLKNAQEHAAGQLNRIVPFMQERAQGLSEITQIAGKQIAQVLQSITLSDHSLKQNAMQGEETIQKLSSTADSLGERLFGAVNLLQASGKVLAETTEKTQSRLDEAIENLKIASPTLGASAPNVSNDSIARMEAVVTGLDAARTKMETLLSEQAEATRARIDLLTVQSTGLLTQTTTASQTMAAFADKLRDEQERLEEAINKLTARTENNDVGSVETAPSVFVDDTQNRLVEIATQVGWIADKMRAFSEAKPTSSDAQVAEPTFVEALLNEMKAGFDRLSVGAEKPRESTSAAALSPLSSSSDIAEQMRDQWFQMAAQIEATRSGLAQIISQEIARLESRLIGSVGAPGGAIDSDALRDAQHQIEQQTNILSELVVTLGVLDTHMQEVRTEVAQRRQAG